MIRILGTVFAALLGLAFGSFLNVCLTRWPVGESIVKPPSHCRNCGRTLAWWENVPLVSWLVLRGRCRTCGAWIGWRYALVEAAVGIAWGEIAWRFPNWAPSSTSTALSFDIARSIGGAIFCWIVVALAALDAEHLWLPDRLTWPGIVLGFIYSVVRIPSENASAMASMGNNIHIQAAILSLINILSAAGIIIFIRRVYKFVRHREGLGLGDAKLMAMLAAWLGLPGALLSFAIGVVLGSLVAIVLRVRGKGIDSWASTMLPLGTFLCIGGIVSSLWGQPIIAAYLRWAGF